MDFRPLIKESLQILSFLSVNPFSSNLIINRLCGRCTVGVVIGVFIDVSLYLSFNYQGGNSTMEVMIVVAFAQLSVKMLFIVTCKKELVLLIKNTNKFWKLNFNEFEHQENEKIFSFVKFCVRGYTVFLFVICMLYIMKPLFFDEVVELPWKSCCSKFFSYKICYVLQVLCTAILGTTALGFDILYISLITNVICEFKLVENRFPNIKINPAVRGTDKEAMDELKLLIDHHNLILECIKIMKEVYRSPMLGLFSLNMFGMCFCMIITTSSTSNSATKLLFGMLSTFYLIQLFFYCIYGSMLADQSVKISAQVHKSMWWIKTQPELRKALIMIIRRANKPEILTAGGLLQVNLQTFTMILRSTVSFFTFMQVMLSEK